MNFSFGFLKILYVLAANKWIGLELRTLNDNKGLSSNHSPHSTFFFFVFFPKFWLLEQTTQQKETQEVLHSILLQQQLVTNVVLLQELISHEGLDKGSLTIKNRSTFSCLKEHY